MMMDSLRKSFKSHHHSSSRTHSLDQEEQPILLDDGDRREVVVKIDGGGNKSAPPDSNSSIWRDSSYDFWKENGGTEGFSFKNQNGAESVQVQDPPSRLIGNFLHKQKASGAEMLLDMDLEMEELKKTTSSPSASRDLRVSFQNLGAPPAPQKPNNPSSSSSSDDEDGSTRSNRRCNDGSEVIRCTSNSSFRHSSTLLRAKTRSRLMDPPPPPDDEKKSGRQPARSGQQLKSGMLGSLDEDDDDPFFDEDLPDEYKRAKLSYLTVLQWLSLIVVLAALISSLSIPGLQSRTVWNLHLWKWEVLVLVLVSGRLVSGWVIRIAVFFIERNFLLRKRLLYFVYGVRKAVQNCLWLGLVLVSWHYLFDKKVERETKSKTLPYVTKILICLIVATIFRLVKTLLVKVLASSFHVSTYFDRIHESLFNQYVIETLSGPPLLEISHSREEEDRVLAEVQKLQNAGATLPNDLRAAAFSSKSGKVTGAMRRSSQIGKSLRFSGAVSKKDTGEGITIDHLHKLNQKNISAWNMKRLIRIVRYGTLSTLDEQIPHATGEDESALQIRSECEAKIAARKIFNNVARPGAKYIYLADLMRFMREEEALKTMSLFEEAQENKRVRKKSLKNWVVNAFRERRALSLTLNDTKTAVNKLHHMANMVVGVIVFAIWLLILGIATTHFFVFLSSQLLLAVFMFGNTLKLIFEDIIFLFVMHPFDVGDRCEVEGVQMIVEEMNILTTIFLKPDNTKVIYPNTVLATHPISNFYRSPDQGDAIDFCVHVSSPVEKIALMKERIVVFMESKKEHWYPSPTVVIKDVEDMNRLKISIWMRHRINFQDMGQKWTRRELVVQELIKILKELDLEYRMLPLDVNCRSYPALPSSTRLPSTWTTCS